MCWNAITRCLQRDQQRYTYTKTNNNGKTDHNMLTQGQLHTLHSCHSLQHLLCTGVHKMIGVCELGKNITNSDDNILQPRLCYPTSYCTV